MMAERRGVSIIEIIIVIAIISIALFAINQLLSVALNTTSQGMAYTKALLYAKEGLEAVRILRNQSWQTNIAPLSTGASYYPAFSGTTWSLEASPPALLDNQFTRAITVENVYRDSGNNIAPSGTLDANTKKITVTIQWFSQGTKKQIAIPTYIANY